MVKFTRLFWIAFLAACLAASPLAGMNQHAQAMASSAVPVLISPGGYFANTRPTYTWNQASGASHYLFMVYKQGLIYYSRVVDSIACGVNTCSISLPAAQPLGSYGWKVRALTGGKWGGFSPLKAFTIMDPAAGPYLLTPNSSSFNYKPTFNWVIFPGANEYWVEADSGNYHYSTGRIDCGGTTCWTTYMGAMQPGIYKWRVRVRYGGSFERYSAYQTFTIKAIPGFTSTFDTDAAGWTGSPTVWKVNTLTGRYTSRGQPGYNSSSAHITDYSTIRYQVELIRGGCYYCANAIMFRGNPTPLTSSGSWNSGYRLAYTNSGFFHVGYYQNGIWNWIIPWTYTPAIQYSNYLEVTMDGSYTEIFINGSRVAYGHLDNFSTGKVGVMFYTDLDPSGNIFQVDNVRLSTVVSMATSLGAGGINMDALELVNAAAAGDPNVAP